MPEAKEQKEMMIYKTLHIKLKIKQLNPEQKPGEES